MTWQHFITRPFSLFGTTLWREWYISALTEKVFGATIPIILGFEEEEGVFRYFVKKEEGDAFLAALRKKIISEKAALIDFMKQGEKLQAMFDAGERPSSVEDAFRFLNEMGIFTTMIPYNILKLAGQGQKIDTEILAMAEKLRFTSYYPRVFSELVNPLADQRVQKLGGQPGDFQFLTMQEILKGDIGHLPKRKGERPKRMMLEMVNTHIVRLDWADDWSETIAEMEDFSGDIRGVVAFPGRVQGTARVIKKIESVREFNKGDILVTINSSPLYMVLIDKAAAIVSDEGGLMCHAGIIARELKKPCIMGTRIATQRIKDGDFIEVDADNGVVRKL